MKLAEMHPEDVKAAIRKQYGTILAFEREHELPDRSVTDFLRGRISARVIEALEKALIPPTQTPRESEFVDCSEVGTDSHRLNAAAR